MRHEYTMFIALGLATAMPATAAVALDAPDSTRVVVADTTVADSTVAVAAMADAAVAIPPEPGFAPGLGPDTFRALRERLARARHLRLQTGYRTFDLWQLELSRDSVRFRIAGEDLEDVPRVLAWQDVHGIQVRGTHRGTGAKAGAIAVGAGAALLLTSLAVDAGWNFSWTDGWAPLLIGGALVLTLAGGLTGAIAGSFVSKWETVYP